MEILTYDDLFIIVKCVISKLIGAKMGGKMPFPGSHTNTYVGVLRSTRQCPSCLEMWKETPKFF